MVLPSEIQDWITQWRSVVSRKNKIQEWITEWRSAESRKNKIQDWITEWRSVESRKKEIQDWITQWRIVVSRKNEIQDLITQWRSNYHFTLKTEARRSSETSVLTSLHHVTWQKTVIIMILLVRMSLIVRRGASKHRHHVHNEQISSNSCFVNLMFIGPCIILVVE